ncbi:glycosyltransferase family 39 protein [Cesiribacter sp. SM1]|uniref:glycosyltransferase family 39 protein n=1 Tax=Cesiribacter sp. SM1 TaxID=2861196 RepID=UPI001CD7BD4E|nr:glycosyltransferase family 39 protein [Cesiribacter sp. SM1]
MEWLQEASYTAWPENPPLARVFIALGPYLNGHNISPPLKGKQTTMTDYFFASYDMKYFEMGAIEEQLGWMRLFVLPLFLLSVGIVWYWARALGGNKAAFLAVGMYALLPPILAHSGLATTDIGFAAFFTLSIFSFARWLNKPTFRRACMFGISMAAALLSKYSALAFFPPAALLMLVLFRFYGLAQTGLSGRIWGLKALKSAAAGIVAAFLSVWAFFGFSTGTLGNEPTIQAAIQEGAISAAYGNLWLPAPEWFAGLALLMLHNQQGHLAYIAGEVSVEGFWYFYSITTLVKTPLPFLLLLLAGATGACLRLDGPRNWEAMALSLLPFIIILGGLTSNINIGIRHILIIYPLGAIGASIGLIRLLGHVMERSRARWKKAVPLTLVLWQLTIAATAYPAYLSYFNPIAGEEPGELLIDSDLDWGQGMFELAEYCRENKIESLSLSYFGLGQDCWYGLPPIKTLSPDSVAEGWVAISEVAYRGVWGGMATPAETCNSLSFRPIINDKLQANTGFRWLDKYPLKAKLAGSIRLYYVGNKEPQQAPLELKGTAR